MAKISLLPFSKRDLDRIGNIMSILVTFQVGKYVEEIQQKEKIPVRISRQRPRSEVSNMSPEERLTLMFEELGTTFVKFGQLLATRDDVIGPDYAAELSKLHDRMKSFPTAQAKKIIEEELGRPVSQIFSSFEAEPMASASISQVHRATLRNGKKVVVKIQRPGIQDTITEDIRIMRYLAHLTEKNIPELRRYAPTYLVDEFERSIMKELDFKREAKNSKRLKDNFKDEKGIYVPEVYDELSTRRIITMEEIKGTKLTDIIKSGSKRFNRRLIAKRCLHAYFKMILVDGFYHADPHPGNIIILKNNVICFLDFGRCATIDRGLAEGIFRLVLFAINNDANGLVAHLLRTNLIEEGPDMKDFKEDLADLLDTYYSSNIEDIEIGNMLEGIMSVISRYNFNRPRELAELTRALLILEGAGRQLDPTFNVSEEFEPYAKKYLAHAFDPNQILDITKNNLLDFQAIAADLPGAVRKFIKKVSEGKITLEMEHKNLAVITEDMKDIGDRLSVSLIIAALIVGSSIMVHALPGSALAVALFVLSAIMGVWLVLKTLVL